MDYNRNISKTEQLSKRTNI